MFLMFKFLKVEETVLIVNIILQTSVDSKAKHKQQIAVLIVN